MSLSGPKTCRPCPETLILEKPECNVCLIIVPLQVIMVGVCGHPARDSVRKVRKRAANSSAPVPSATNERPDSSYCRSDYNDDFTAKDGSRGQRGRVCTDSMWNILSDAKSEVAS